jgi:hypothetical protein
MAKIKILAGDFPEGNCDYSWGDFNFGFLSKNISDKQLDTVEIATEESVKRIGGTVGWGVAGAVILGPVGLLAGLLLGGKSKDITFIAKFKNGKKFMASTDNKTFTKLQAVTFKKKTSIYTNNSNTVIKDSAESKVDSIQKLLDLGNMFDKGLITEEEFKKYKEELESKPELQNNTDEYTINSNYKRKNGKIYTLTKEGLVLEGKNYATYGYKDSIERLSKSDEFSKCT